MSQKKTPFLRAFQIASIANELKVEVGINGFTDDSKKIIVSKLNTLKNNIDELLSQYVDVETEPKRKVKPDFKYNIDPETLVDVFVDGENDFSHEITKDVVIYHTGTVYQMRAKDFDKFVGNLDYDNYFCPQLYKHPEWSGIIRYEN